jgi:hypothetical protein
LRVEDNKWLHETLAFLLLARLNLRGQILLRPIYDAVQLAALAGDLVERCVDAIVVFGGPPIVAKPFVDYLRGRGWEEDHDIVFERRFVGTDPARWCGNSLAILGRPAVAAD